jgi:histidine phosphotransfer protein HptB
MTDVSANSPRIYSALATDPDLADLVEMFVGEMPKRIATLSEQLGGEDWDGLRRTAHQLKGAAGSYGFAPMTPVAGKVESAIRDGEPESNIRQSVAELVDLCGRLCAGLPQ